MRNPFMRALLGLVALAGAVLLVPHQQASAAWSQPQFARTIGTPAHAAVYAWGVAYNPVTDEILVSDYWNFQIRRYDGEGSYLGSFYSKPSDRKGQPYSLAVDPGNGDVYVGQVGDGQARGYVGRYDQSGEFLGNVYTGATYPAWISVTANRTMWVTDAHNDTTPNVREYRLDGTLLRSFGSYGDGAGQFGKELHGVDTDASGNVYVADVHHKRVQVYSPRGSFLRNIGSGGTGPGRFRGDLRGVTVDDERGLVYVVDAAASEVEVFELDGTPVRTFGSEGQGDGQFTDGGRQVTLDGDGEPWVADYGNYRVQQFTRDGAFASAAPRPAANPPVGGFAQNRDVDVDPSGGVWVADSWNNRFCAFGTDGALRDCWGRRGSLPPLGMNYPRGIGVDPQTGNIWVASTREHVVRVYDRNANHLFSTQFSWPIDFTFRGDGTVAVTSSSAAPISILRTSDGSRVETVGNALFSTAYDPQSRRLYAVSTRSDVVAVYDEDLDQVDTFGGSGTGPGKFSRPWDVDVVDGVVYVADAALSRVQAFTGTGDYLGSVGSRGAGPEQLIAPSGLAHDASGNLYVADAGNDRVSVFSTTAPPDPQDGTAGRVALTAPGAGEVLPARSPVTVTGTYGDDVRAFSADVAVRDTDTGLWWDGRSASWVTSKVWNRAAMSGTATDGEYHLPVSAVTAGHGYTAQARVRDAAGNTSPATAARAFRVAS